MKKLSTLFAFGLSLALLAPVYAEETTTAPAAEGAAKPVKAKHTKKTAVTPAATAEKPATEAKPAGDAATTDAAAKPAKKAKPMKKDKEVKADAPTK